MDNAFMKKLQQIIDDLDLENRAREQEGLNALLTFGMQAETDLFKIIGDENADENIRVSAFWFAGRLGDKRALKPLLSALKDENPRLREAAARTLGELNDEKSCHQLILTMLNDNNIQVKFAATYALGLIGKSETLETIISVLENKKEDPSVRGMAAEALADLRDIRAVEPLIEALDDPHVEVRFWAVYALGQLSDSRALQALKRIADYDDAQLPDVGSLRAEAIESIKLIEEKF